MAKTSKIHQRLRTPAQDRKPLVSPTPKKGSFAASREVEKNTFWDDAKNFYFSFIQGLDQTHGQLVEYLQKVVADEALRSHLKDQAALVTNIRILERDIVEHKARIDAIYEKHKDRSGSTLSPDDHAFLIQINGMYADAFDVYNSNVMPTVSHIFELTGAAEALLEAERLAEKSALNDPSIVSDVEVKQAEPTVH